MTPQSLPPASSSRFLSGLLSPFSLQRTLKLKPFYKRLTSGKKWVTHLPLLWPLPLNFLSSKFGSPYDLIINHWTFVWWDTLPGFYASKKKNLESFTLHNSSYQKHFTLSKILITNTIRACLHKSNLPKLFSMNYLSKHSVKIDWSPTMCWVLF